MARQVVLYCQPDCPECEATKQFLERHEIRYVERTVAFNPQAIEELRRLGALKLPVVLVDAEPILGFDRRRLAAALHGEEPPLTDGEAAEELERGRHGRG